MPYDRIGRVEDGWRPMKTAPMDRAVLLYGTMLPFEGIKSDGPLVFTGYWDSIDEQWCTTGSTWTGPFFEPTHWRPIPDPPPATAIRSAGKVE